MSNDQIDFNNFDIKKFQKEFAEKAKAGQPFTGKDGILTPAIPAEKHIGPCFLV
jgi:hypothetical protein